MNDKAAEQIELRQNPLNLNQGTEEGVRLLQHSVEQLGAGRSGLAAANGEMIAGNHTLDAMIAAGIPIKTIDVTGDEWVVLRRTDLKTATEPKAMELGLADNLITIKNQKLDVARLLEQSEDMNVATYLSTSELKALIKKANKEQALVLPEDLDRKTEGNLRRRAEKNELPIRCSVGQIWQLGRHRLLIGDMADQTLVYELMDGDSANMIFTDPPYNTGEAQGRSSSKWGKIKNDDMSDENFADFLISFNDTMGAIALPEAHRYIFCDWQSYTAFVEVLGLPKACIIWAKNIFGLGKGYRPQHEFLLFYGKGLDSNSESNLWSFPREHDPVHPMQKPTELIIRALNNSSEPDQIIFDPFAGSGSVLMACQLSDRICRCIELDPRYGTVILERFEALTGLTPELLS